MLKKHWHLFAGLIVSGLVLGYIFIGQQQETHALGTPQIVSINPGSGAPVGTCVSIRAKVAWDGDFRSMRIRFGNEGWQEEATPEFERTFCTGNLSPGWYTIRVEVSRQGDNNWSNTTSAEASYELTAANQPPPSPTQAPPVSASCSITGMSVSPMSGQVGTTFTISGSGSCTNGVRAIRFKVDGGIIYELGAPQTTTTWSGSSVGNHTITVEVADAQDPNWAYAAGQSTTVSVTNNNPPPPGAASYFSTGDIIQIGPDIYVIVDGSRRLVPNPATLDALGITRDRINNKGLSEADLNSISRGSDIPDVSVDRSGFDTFKATYFGGSVPINPPTAPPPQPTATSPSAPPAPTFATGDIIQIGPDIFVIVDGSRRLVPNPATLDALGITRDWINNKGQSGAQLSQLPRGSDIPDVTVDQAGFDSFKATYFSYTTPINSNPTQQPTSPPPTTQPDTSCPTTNAGLSIGIIAVVTSEMNVRDLPGLASNVMFSFAQGTLVSIISGPVCKDGNRWWEVGTEGKSGWASEASMIVNGAPLLTPAPPSADTPQPIPPTSLPASQPTAQVTSDSTCPAASTRVSPGGIAVVTDATLASLSVYSRPGEAVMFSWAPYTYVTIISGPECKDGNRWFEAGADGKSGWVTEVGVNGFYNLIPNGAQMPGIPASSNTKQPELNIAPNNTPVEVVPSMNNQVFLGLPMNPGVGDIVQVTIEALRFRDQPNQDSNILGYVQQWHYYPLLQQQGDWGQIHTASGQEGWIYLPGYTVIPSTSETGSDSFISCDGVEVMDRTGLENCAQYRFPGDGVTTTEPIPDFNLITPTAEESAMFIDDPDWWQFVGNAGESTTQALAISAQLYQCGMTVVDIVNVLSLAVYMGAFQGFTDPQTPQNIAECLADAFNTLDPVYWLFNWAAGRWNN